MSKNDENPTKFVFYVDLFEFSDHYDMMMNKNKWMDVIWCYCNNVCGKYGSIIICEI